MPVHCPLSLPDGKSQRRTLSVPNYRPCAQFVCAGSFPRQALGAPSRRGEGGAGGRGVWGTLPCPRLRQKAVVSESGRWPRTESRWPHTGPPDPHRKPVSHRWLQSPQARVKVSVTGV